MKTVAIVGYGFMGRVHAACWRKVRGVRIAAVCVRDPAVLAKSVKVYGCVGDALPADLPSDVAVYTDLDALLREVRPDYVDVARDAREADRILRAAARAKGRLLVAQCLRFAPEYAYLKRLVESGKYGAVAAASFSRLTPPPCAPGGGASWFHDERKSAATGRTVKLQ